MRRVHHSTPNIAIRCRVRLSPGSAALWATYRKNSGDSSLSQGAVEQDMPSAGQMRKLRSEAYPVVVPRACYFGHPACFEMG
jgi:hypothetical protein